MVGRAIDKILIRMAASGLFMAAICYVEEAELAVVSMEQVIPIAYRHGLLHTHSILRELSEI